MPSGRRGRFPIGTPVLDAARSLGPALVGAGSNPNALAQVWLFFVAPLIGGALAGLHVRTYVVFAYTAAGILYGVAAAQGRGGRAGGGGLAGRSNGSGTAGFQIQTPVLSTTGGTSDGRFIRRICPQVVEFGPVNTSIHKLNEHVELAAVEPLRRIYQRVLEKLLA